MNCQRILHQTNLQGHQVLKKFVFSNQKNSLLLLQIIHLNTVGITMSVFFFFFFLTVFLVPERWFLWRIAVDLFISYFLFTVKKSWQSQLTWHCIQYGLPRTKQQLHTFLTYPPSLIDDRFKKNKQKKKNCFQLF